MKLVAIKLCIKCALCLIRLYCTSNVYSVPIEADPIFLSSPIGSLSGFQPEGQISLAVRTCLHYFTKAFTLHIHYLFFFLFLNLSISCNSTAPRCSLKVACLTKMRAALIAVNSRIVQEKKKRGRKIISKPTLEVILCCCAEGV